MLDKSYFSNTVYAAAAPLVAALLWGLGVKALDPCIAAVSITYIAVKAVLNPRREPFDAALLAASAALAVAAARSVAALLLKG